MSKKQSSTSVRARREKMRTRRQKQRRVYYVIAAAGAVIIIGLFAIIRQLTAPSLNDFVIPDPLTPPSNADGKAWGPVDAPVVVEEYGDFQWPYCGQFATGAGRQLEEAYADSGLVRFEYKHFAFIGAESTRAAEASECANEQGQFWPFHDTIFANQRGENQGRFNKDALRLIAAALELDETEFNKCLDSGRYRKVVQNESAAARERDVKSTPTLFINGELVEGALPFEQLQSRIEAELAK